MARIGFFAPPFWGHLNPMSALARELASRGHAVVLIAQPDAVARGARNGLEGVAVGHDTHPAGDLAATERLMGRIAGPITLRRLISGVARRTDMLARCGSEAARSLRLDAVVTDQLEPAGALVAEQLQLPYVSVANALLINREAEMPPVYTGWRYDPNDWGQARNRGGYRVADLLMRPVGEVIAGWCQRWHLPPRDSVEACLSPYAQLSQTVPGFDFPRRELPAVMHSCGPLRAPAADEAFAMPQANGQRPVVYISLGTLQGARIGLFRLIAQACRKLGLAMVIAHGGRLSDAQAATLPGNPVVRSFVPQAQVLRSAALAVTNGGLNTVLDALANAVPVVTIPIAFEQGAIAARLENCGAGISVRRLGLGPKRLARMLDQVLHDLRYHEQAAALAGEIASSGGAAYAAGIVERVIATGQPVTRGEMAA